MSTQSDRVGAQAGPEAVNGASTGLPELAQSLLDAVLAISSDLDLRSVLTRIVESVSTLTGAHYAALGVIGNDGTLREFITTGLTEDERARIGDLPRGHGILGLLIKEPDVLRLTDLSQHRASAGFPPNHPVMRSFLGVPVRIRGTVFGNLYLTEKHGGEPFTPEDEVLVAALASAAGFVIENARAYGLSERRRRWLEASSGLSDALQPPIDVGAALRLIAQSARAVSGSRGAAIVGYRREGARTVDADRDDRDAVDEALDAVLELPLPARGGPAAEIEVDGMTALAIPLRAHLTERAALVVLYDSGQVPQDFEERDLLAAFADQAALALDRAQAIVDREELAVISDRERIARDLHDVVIQRLFATGMHLQGIAMSAGNAEVVERLDRAVNDLDLTIKDIRGTIFQLQQQRTDSLRAEVRDLVQEYVPLLGFSPAVRTTGPLDTAVPDAVRQHLLPVLREALSNVARHASAQHAEVEVGVDGSELWLSVTDDGVGLKEERNESGLRNARRRATTLAGAFELAQVAPRGTRFVWRVPIS